jgi:hypothetical protein
MEIRMDDRLAALRHEVDTIMSTGPIGRWTNPPATFAMMSETVLFNADGSGLVTSRSGMMGTSRQKFEWSVERPGRLVMRFLRREDDGASQAPTDRDEAPPVTLDIEIKIQETEFAPWPVMTKRSSDVFGNLWCALARDDPPLVLPVARPKRTMLTRLRDVITRHL